MGAKSEWREQGEKEDGGIFRFSRKSSCLEHFFGHVSVRRVGIVRKLELSDVDVRTSFAQNDTSFSTQVP